MKSIDYDHKKHIDVEWFKPYIDENKKKLLSACVNVSKEQKYIQR